jgi:hypothetical protein
MRKIIIILGFIILFICLFVNLSWAEETKANPFYTESWFWSMLQFLVITATLWIIARQISLQTEQLESQSISNMLSSFNTLDEKWVSKTMLKSRNEICKKNVDEDNTINIIDEFVLGFFEDLGIYLNKGVYDLETVWHKYSFEIENYWPLLDPLVRNYRKETGDQEGYSCFEKLYERIIKYSLDKGIKSSEKTKENICKFVEDELKDIEMTNGIC